MEKFIPNTNEQYSITSEGKVYMHYHIGVKYKKKFFKKEEKKIICINNIYNVCLKINNVKTKRTITSLMESIFELSPPDKLHKYVLQRIDTKKVDFSLKNLTYKLISKKNFGFYPQTFHNEKNILTHKICACCGNKYPIEHFYLRKNNSYNHLTRRCSTVKYILSKFGSEENFKLYCQKRKNTYKKTDRYKNYKESLPEKNRALYAKHRENISDVYLKLIIANHHYAGEIEYRDVTPQLIELKRKEITLQREIKKYEEEQKN